MAKIAVFASGSGTNFQAIADRLKNTDHDIALLVCDRKKAYANSRAREIDIPVLNVSYVRESREEIESRLIGILLEKNIDLIVLAGYMRMLTPVLIEAFPNKIINIHPALLPKYPGTRGIEESFASEDRELGITIHYVDHGMDTGPVICQKSFLRNSDETLESVEERIHGLEHRWYPDVILDLLDQIEA